MKFIIYTPSYDENIGGFIVLHQLCHELNKMGEEAYIWKKDEPPLNWNRPFHSLYRILRYNYLFKKKFNRDFHLREGWITPIADLIDLSGAVVVYPEVTSGNPLGVKKVVRWFLNKPGALTGTINYGSDELYFYYAKAFNDKEINPDSKNQLTLVTVMDDIYKQTNFGKRHGSCYMLRKGKEREIIHDKEDSVLVDGLTHSEIAAIFNKTERFISYDLYTMYSVYAVMCGCISIVVPDSSVSKEEWKESHGKEKYGIAYGFDDEEIAYAKNTQHKVMQSYAEIRNEQDEMLKIFVEKCKDKFNG